MDANLTADDFDWLRQLKGATDAKRDPPPIPTDIAAKLRAFGLASRIPPAPSQLHAKGVMRCWSKTCATPKTASSCV